MHITGKIFGLFLCFVLSMPVSMGGEGQGKQRLETFINEKRSQWQEDKDEVMEFAKRTGIPVRKLLPDGTIIALKEIINGFPVYDQTLNLGAAITSSVNEVWPGGEAGLELTGDGRTLGIWDGGGGSFNP